MVMLCLSTAFFICQITLLNESVILICPCNFEELDKSKLVMAPNNVILFGESGVGKSSIVNMLLENKSAPTSSSAIGCTLQYRCYFKDNFVFYDTAGFNEGSAGSVVASEALFNLVELMKSLKDGVSLLIYVVKKGRITKTTEDNYKLFVTTICMSKVPVILVITNCEQEAQTGAWWEKEKSIFINTYKMDFKEIVSATTIDGNDPSISLVVAPLFRKRYAETKIQLEMAINRHVMENPWVAQNWTKWLISIFGNLIKLIIEVMEVSGFPIADALESQVKKLGLGENITKMLVGLVAVGVKSTLKNNSL